MRSFSYTDAFWTNKSFDNHEHNHRGQGPTSPSEEADLRHSAFRQILPRHRYRPPQPEPSQALPHLDPEEPPPLRYNQHHPLLLVVTNLIRTRPSAMAQGLSRPRGNRRRARLAYRVCHEGSLAAHTKGTGTSASKRYLYGYDCESAEWEGSEKDEVTPCAHARGDDGSYGHW
jgi:hypothetical protein